MKFEQNFELLDKDNPALGQIATIPWDIETFGFGVADYKFDYSQNPTSHNRVISKKIEQWAKQNNIELIGTTAEANDYSQIAFIQSLGFRYIDTTILVKYPNIQQSQYPKSNLVIAPAIAEQLDEIVQISSDVFETGRYHSDKSFPKKLADKRYRDWVKRAFHKENQQELFVLQKNNQICAFLVIEIKGKEGRLHLNAVSRNFQGKGIGSDSIALMLSYYKNNGVENAITKVSVSNTRALNLHSKLGAQFENSQILFHWHAPWAKHLLTIETN